MPYVTRAIHPATPDQHWDKGPHLTNPTVDGPKETDTGLVDIHGNVIMRLQPPVGFGRDGEW